MVRPFLSLALLLAWASIAAAQIGGVPAGATLAPTAGRNEQSAKDLPTNEVIELEFFLVEGGGKEAANDAEWDLTGPADQVAAKLQTLEKGGKAMITRRIKLTTVENIKTTAQFGERKAMVTGAVAARGGRGGPGFEGGLAGGGPVTRSYQYASVGSLLDVTTSVRDGGVIGLELQFEHSDIAKTPPAAASGDGAADPNLGGEPAGTTTLTIRTSARLENGQTTMLSGSSSGNHKQVLLVTAKMKK